MPIQLRFLSLMRCTSLTGEAIVEFFCGAGASVTSKLVDLCLGSDDSSPTRIEYDQLSTVLQTAPCFHSGLLRVLDLSSCPLDDDLLLSMPITSKLITLGLACCRSLTLEGIASFLRDKAPTVECLDLNKSCAPLHQRPPLGSRRMTGLPHLNSLDLHFQLINQLCPEVDNIEDRPIGLRIIELEERALAGLGAGVGPWKPIYCGRRCFYVETSITGFFEGGERRLVKLALDSEERQGMLKLTEKGTQSDARFGWRRM